MAAPVGVRSLLRSNLERGRFDEVKRLLQFIPNDRLIDEIGHLTPRMALVLCSIMDNKQAADVLCGLDRRERQRVLGCAKPDELRKLLKVFNEEQLVQLIDELPSRQTDDILKALPKDRRARVMKQMPYPPGSVGSIMTRSFVLVGKDASVSDAIEHIRKDATARERVYSCFVSDSDGVFLGTVLLEDLVLTDPDSPLEPLIDYESQRVSPDIAREEAARLMSRYDLHVLPVVDGQHIVGVVTFDDVLDVLEEDNAELFAKMGGLTDLDMEQKGVLTQFKRRFPYLLLCTIAGILTTGILESAEDTLSQIIALAFFIPLLMDTGGNTGAQISVLVIRGMSLGELDMKSIKTVLLRELLTGVMLGVAMAVLAMGRAYLLGTGMGVGLVVAFAMFAVVISANMLGALLPFVTSKVGLDPAMIAGPLLTTIVDVLGLAIYLGIAKAFLL